MSYIIRIFIVIIGLVMLVAFTKWAVGDVKEYNGKLDLGLKIIGIILGIGICLSIVGIGLFGDIELILEFIYRFIRYAI